MCVCCDVCVVCLWHVCGVCCMHGVCVVCVVLQDEYSALSHPPSSGEGHGCLSERPTGWLAWLSGAVR
jgi:hypothetical protein